MPGAQEVSSITPMDAVAVVDRRGVLFTHRPGESARVVLIRDGQERGVAVTLGKRRRE